MKLSPATEYDVRQIFVELDKQSHLPLSGDFLLGFPTTSVSWHKAELDIQEFENLYLFWDGSAWGQNYNEPPRTLKEGVPAFQQIDGDATQPDNNHLKQIKSCLEKLRAREFETDRPFLILAGDATSKHFIILDGNHRAAAAYWWSLEAHGLTWLPLVAWVGLSPEMLHYSFYSRIFR